MTLPLPPVSDENLQFIVDEIAKRFPIQNQDIAGGVLKLLVGANVRVAWGLANVSIVSDTNGTATVNHGLPHAPGLVLATPVTSSGVTPATAAVDGDAPPDATTLTLRVYMNPSTSTVTTDVDVYWLAIG